MPTPAKAATAPDDVPAAQATVTTTTVPNPQASHLDLILVGGTMAIVAGVVAALVFAKIDQSQLAILASIVSGLMGAVIGGYTGYRWGASDAQKRQTTQATAAQ